MGRILKKRRSTILGGNSNLSIDLLIYRMYSVQCIYRNSKSRVKEAIHIKLHPNNIDRDSGIEIPEAWMPTIRHSGTTADQYQSGQLGEQFLV